MSAPNPVRCAVIGTKNIAGQHIPVLQALPEAEVAALCDIDVEALNETSRRFGIEQTFTSVDDLQAWGEFDAVYVLVSVLAVAEVAERFIRAGIPTFLEKPPGLYSSDTERLAEAVRETGTTAMVGLNRRFYTCLQAGRRSAAGYGRHCLGDGARRRSRRSLTGRARNFHRKSRHVGPTRTAFTRWTCCGTSAVTWPA